MTTNLSDALALQKLVKRDRQDFLRDSYLHWLSNGPADARADCPGPVGRDATRGRSLSSRVDCPDSQGVTENERGDVAT